MSVELDHLFICTPVNAPEAEILTRFGLTQGRSRRHPGQGTQNRCFFFRNLMLELLWVCDRAEAQSELTTPTHLWERWQQRQSGACPFGICLRPSSGQSPVLPFTSWNYYPQYFPPSQPIAIATNSQRLTEPMLFYLSIGQRPDTNAQPFPMQHPVPLQEVSRVTLITPHAQTPSPELQGVIEAGLIQIKEGDTYGLEIGFDGEKQGEWQDFRPQLPLIFYW